MTLRLTGAGYARQLAGPHHLRLPLPYPSGWQPHTVACGMLLACSRVGCAHSNCEVSEVAESLWCCVESVGESKGRASVLPQSQSLPAAKE